MTILALEFSSSRRSVAALHEDGGSEAVQTGGHGTNVFRLIEEALAGAALDRGQVEVIAVGLGPGSYTGIRVALSVAQGWQLARGVKLLGIGSVEGLAAQAQAANIHGTVKIVIDAQRDEFYQSTCEISSSAWKEIEPLKITNLAGSTGDKTGDVWIGPEVTRWCPQGKILFPSAAALARLAKERHDFMSGENLSPIYLRDITFAKAPPLNPIVS